MIRIDARLSEHPKVAALSGQAFRTYIASICHCAQRGDSVLGHEFKARPSVIDELLRAELWQQAPVGVEVWGRGAWWDVEADPLSLKAMRAKWRKMRASVAGIVFARQPECVACGATDNLTVDHVRPLAAGGNHDLDNLQTLCAPCNSSKGARW